MVITCEVQADTRAWRERTPQPRAGAAMGVETGAVSLPLSGRVAWPAWGASFATVVPRPQGGP